MNSLILAGGAVVLYIIAYNTYGRFLAKKLFQINRDTPCPGETHHLVVNYLLKTAGEMILKLPCRNLNQFV